MDSSQKDVTRLLQELVGGNRDVVDQLTPLVYDELRRLARFYLRGERSGHTLQPTALVHEAYLHLVDQRDVQWQSRSHFFGIAAQLMRRILVDYARSRHAIKRGGRQSPVPLEDEMVVAEDRLEDLIALDEALAHLAALDPQQVRIVELRSFGGLSVEETAELLCISPATVKRDWSVAKAWLHREMTRDREP